MSVDNCVLLCGRLGKAPTVRTTSNGNKIAEFSIAISKNWKDKSGQKQEKTTWITIQCWKKLAELVDTYVKKGSQILVSGELSTDSWEKDGVKHYKTFVVADSIRFFSEKKTAEPTAPVTETTDDDNEMPF